MAYAKVNTISRDDIPVIDAAALVSDDPAVIAETGKAMREAAERIGFFYVSNHGVPQEIVDGAFAASKAFFAQDEATKRTAQINDRHRGFLAVGQAKMYAGAKIDLKESFLWGLELDEKDSDVAAGKPLMGPNNWPASQPALRTALSAYYDAVLGCGQRLLRGFAAALDLPAEHFAEKFRKPLARGSAIWYPPQPPELGESQFGVSAHTDYGCITILTQDTTGGLQVQNRAGEWIAAPPIPGTYVINIGDLMARWTNDLFVSTPHRVVNSSGRERQSIAVFYDPHPDTEIAVLPACVRPGIPPSYAPTTCGEHIIGRFARSFAYRKETAPAG